MTDDLPELQYRAGERKLKILALTHDNAMEGCVYARLYTPLRALASAGAVEYKLVEVARSRIRTVWCIIRDLRNWDIVWVQRPHHYYMLLIMRAAQRLGKPVLVDIDDWLLNMPPDHPDAFPWRSKDYQETLRLSLESADAVTVSTPHMAAHCAALGLVTHVLPNVVDCDKFVRFPRSGKIVTIGFCGTPSHGSDVTLIESGLRQLLARGPDQLRVVSVGCPIPGLRNVQGYTHYDTVPATEYPRFLSRLCIDIGLAPLLDTPFNHAKSDIKYLEYSATGAATAASSVAPYRASIASDRGLMVPINTPDSWAHAMDSLFTDGDMRARLAACAYKWTRKERSITAMADKWYRLFCAYAGHAAANMGREMRQERMDTHRFDHTLAHIVLQQAPHDARELGQRLRRVERCSSIG